MTDQPTTAADTERGLYRKYNVERLGGTPGKHDECEYFVLDLMHDIHAREALRAYAASCRAEYPELAASLDEMVNRTVTILTDNLVRYLDNRSRSSRGRGSRIGRGRTTDD